VSRLLDLARAAGTARAGRPHDTWGAPVAPPAALHLEHHRQRRSALLVAAGDLAEAINTHLTACRVCRMDFYVTDDLAPLCPDGLELRRWYRNVRLVALRGEPLSPAAPPEEAEQ
jgi:hypothetical protein